MTKLKRRLTLVGIALGIILGVSLSKASSVLASELVLPVNLNRCKESQVFDVSGILVYDSKQGLNRMGSTYSLFFEEVKQNYTTDLGCAGLQIGTSFDLALQQALAQGLLPLISQHPKATYSVVVCDFSNGELKAVVTLGKETINWQDKKETVTLEVNGKETLVPLRELIKASCGETSLVNSLSEANTLSYQKPKALPIVEKVSRHSLIASNKGQSEVFLSTSNSVFSTLTLAYDNEPNSPQTNQEILNIIDTVAAAHKKDGG